MKLFIKILIVITIFFSNVFLFAQQKRNEEIKKVISIFFEGLHSGDTTKIKKTISQHLFMQTAYINNEGVSVLKGVDVSIFLKSVASKKSDDIWFEKLLDYKIMIDSNIASVWTPYEFYHNNKFSHCGSNSFQLFNNGENSKIIYLLDTRKHKDCYK